MICLKIKRGSNKNKYILREKKIMVDLKKMVKYKKEKIVWRKRTQFWNRA